MGQYRESTARELGQALMQLNKSFFHFNQKKLNQVFAGCKPSEMRALFIIREGTKAGAREMKVSEISKLLHVTSPTVTQLIKSLEADELVERRTDPRDRRAVGIALTARGESVARRVEEIFTASIQGLIEYLGEEQSHQLIELLGNAIHFFNEKEMGMHHPQWNGVEKA